MSFAMSDLEKSLLQRWDGRFRLPEYTNSTTSNQIKSVATDSFRFHISTEVRANDVSELFIYEIAISAAHLQLKAST